jgi:Ca-activated chloride channel homolog
VAIAYDGLGIQLGRDELTLNEGGERFWFRLSEPREGTASGPTPVRMTLRAPSPQVVQRVTLLWNDVVRAVLTSPPWQASIDIPAEELGILRGVALLDDGRTAEDAVLLNARGQLEHAFVQLVELPVTVSGGNGAEASLSRNEIQVREGNRRRTIDSIQHAADAPLTLGVIIDTSGSMLQNLAEVQEAAIGFLDKVLTSRDRAFVVAFSSRASLVQPATSDKAALEQSILRLRARGSTALYDAIAVGLLQLEGVKGRRALVVFTDGADRTSRYGASDIADLARRTHVPIHLIAAPPDRNSQSRTLPGAQGLEWGAMFRGLSTLAQSTGGSAYRLDRLENLPQVYQQIETALHSQFLVFVRTDPGTSENEWRNIKVDIATRGVKVHAPEGYYAPW